MKKQRLIKFTRTLFSILLLAFGVFSVISIFLPDVADALMAFVGLGGSGGAMLANTTIVGTQTREKTQTSSPNHIKRDVSTVVTEMRPDEFPLDTMLRNIRKAERAKELKVEFETVKYRERVATVDTTFTAAGTDADELADIVMTSVDIFGVHDSIDVKSINGADSKSLRLLVLAINRSTKTLTVTAVNSPTSGQRVPTIAAGTEFFRMGTAKDELASTTDVVNQEPTLDFNYCQTHMAFLEESVIRSLLKSESGYSQRDKFVQQIYDMRSSLEATNLYGIKGKVLDKSKNNEAHYLSDGLNAKIQNEVTFEGNDTTSEAITKKDITKLLEMCFSGNAGSESRLLLSGGKLIKHLQDVGLEKQIGPTQIKVVHGVTVQQLETNFGVLNIKHSKMMDQRGDNEVGFVIDLKHVYKHDFEKMNKKDIDPDKAGLRRVKNAVRILETSCITTRYEDVHFRWVRDAGNAN